ncbi:hypothetical protein BJ944DRAFT_287554 [Cunninghamella echinulata]|nr:hypothetical protein BJ944DRAFT_287554 [Cunninghamella echinulata]
MEEYSTEDLIIVPWHRAVFGKCLKVTSKAINLLIKSWLSSPILKPKHTNSTWEDYKGLSKNMTLIRLSQTDWPEGLYMIQICQLDEAVAVISRTSKMKVWKLIPSNSSNMEIHFDRRIIRQRIQQYLSNFFKSHVYCFDHIQTKTIWYKIHLFVNKYQNTLPRTSITIIHFPNTEYFVFTQPSKKYYEFLIHALLNAYHAEAIQQQFLTAKKLSKLIEITEKKNHLGIFTQFAALQSDPNQNPLLLSRTQTPSSSYLLSESEPPSSEPPSSSSLPHKNHNNNSNNLLTYTSGQEYNRRIIPIHQQQLNKRYNHIEQVFGKYPLSGSDSLYLRLNLPITKVLHQYGIITDTEMEELNSNSNVKEEEKEETVYDGDKHLNSPEANNKLINDTHENDIFSDQSEIENEINYDDQHQIEDEDGDEDEDEDEDVEMDDQQEDYHHKEEKNEKLWKLKRKQHDQLITMNIAFSGSNVMEGLRQMAIQGFMDAPYPMWAAEATNSGCSHLHVTNDQIIINELKNK